MAVLTIPTQDDYTELYLDLADEAAPDQDISQYADFNNKGQVLGGLTAGAAQDAYTLFNNVYPQYANQDGINLGLSSGGVPIQYPASPAALTVTGNGLVSSKTYNVPIGTTMTATNNATYFVIPSNDSNLVNVIVTTVNPTLYLLSTAVGQNTGQLINAVLTITPPIVSTDGTSTLSTVTVTASADGANQETLTNATNRLIEIKQIPLCGTRSTDFKYLAIDLANTVTDAIVLIKNKIVYTTGNYNVAIFDVSGTPITNTTLNLGLLPATTAVVFSRATAGGNIANTQAVMDNQDIVGAFPIVNTVATQGITALSSGFLQVTVTLQEGYQLDDNITLTDGTFTLEQIIQREVRRAICQQPYGATLISDPGSGVVQSSYIPLSAIEQQLDNSLGTPATTGTLGSYLLDRSILTWNGSGYVYTPTLPLSIGIPTNPANPLQWIYDISTTSGNIYANIVVESST